MKLFQKQKQVPDKEDMEEELENHNIPESEKQKEEFAKMLETMLVNSFMAGKKTASIQGTKRDKMFLMMIINSGMTVMAVVLIALQMFVF